jgi:ABC-type lipoprotein release transport system permease subunit
VSLERRLAWRNVWRNSRRTALCVAATVFAVYLVVLSVAMAAGTHEKMIEDGVRLHSGHVLVTGAGYLEDRTLEHFVRVDERLTSLLDSDPAVLGWTPRVASFALLSKGNASQGAVVLGVDPDREGSVTTLPARIRTGAFLSGGARREMVLGERLAHSLAVGVGDELLAYGMAYSLETAYELFTVVGLMSLPEPELERSLALISLADAQEFFVYGDRVSEVAILAESADATESLQARLQAQLADAGVSAGGRTGSDGGEITVHTWQEVMPELENLVLLDDAGMYLMLIVLVVVVAFGILNTILMAILERTRELGMMMALGLRPGAIFRMVYWESIFMAAVGLAIGLALALPSVLYLTAHPIELTGEAMAGVSELFGMEPVMTFKLTARNPIGSAVTILLVGALAALYPARKASRARPVEALRAI